MIRIPFIGMVNIVAGKEICPEMVQGKATPQALADSIVPFLHDGQPRRTMIEALKSVNSSLGSGDAARTTAGFIAEELNSESD
jgi:lipid-A-disaccharide synthase